MEHSPEHVPEFCFTQAHFHIVHVVSKILTAQMADHVSLHWKGKLCNFEAYLCGSLYSTFKTSFQPYAFHNKRLQTLFIDQLAQSKVTYPFKIGKASLFNMKYELVKKPAN